MSDKKQEGSAAFADWFAFVVGLVVALLVILSGRQAFADQAGDLKRQFENINQRMQHNLLQSNKQLEMGAFHKAREYTDLVLQDLDRIIEATMPLRERIVQLLEKEEVILYQTGHLAAENRDVDGSTINNRFDELIRDQTHNREQTVMVANRISSQLNGKMPSLSEVGVDAKPQSKTLNEVKNLIDESAAFQMSVVSSLEARLLEPAKKKETNAVESLKKALEKLQQNGQAEPEHQARTNSQSNQQANNQQSSNNQKQTQSQSQQESMQLQEMETAQTNPNKQVKMTPQDALKELQRIKKQAKVEKASRIEQFGPPVIGQQLPVDKDW